MSAPERLPLRKAGTWRKRWHYIGAFADDFMLCAARLSVGPLGQTFWAVWDRPGEQLWERTVSRLPGVRGEVWSEGDTFRIDARHPELGEVRGFLRIGEGRAAECTCPTGEGDGFVWTRKRAGFPVSCDLRLGGRRFEFEARGIEDESAGYHPRHTVWSWSAGVGEAVDGRRIGWNLVEGVNDPAEGSERAIWVRGEPSEPPTSSFEGLDAISFPGGERLEFSPEAVRERSDNVFVVRSSYRQPFGTFRGTLPGGIELAAGFGVMEHHDARW